MPYKSTSDKKLPKKVRALPLDLRRKWITIFNKVYEEEGEKMALIAAYSWLVKEFDKNKKEAIARSQKIRSIKLELQKEDGQLIKRSENGDDYVTFLLQDVEGDSDGITYSPEVLEKWAEQINSGEIVLGDFDHRAYDEAQLTTVQEKTFIQRLKEKPSIAKAVRAIFEQGKLWVKAIVDKRYKKKIEESQGVSLEAIIERDTETNMVQGGDLIGFSFMVGEPQANPRARVTV